MNPVQRGSAVSGTSVVERSSGRDTPDPERETGQAGDNVADLTDFFSRDSEEIAEFVDPNWVGVLPAFPNPLRNPIRAASWLIRTVFGIASLILLLAVIAAIPIVNFLALGYLLEVEGRVARTGRLRNAFPLLALAPRVGSIALGVFLWLIPIRLLADRAADAYLINPAAPNAGILNFLTSVSSVIIGCHLCLALARGGSLGCFLRPIKNIRWLIAQWREGGYWERAEKNVTDFVAGLRLRHHFSLGFRGFIGAFVWLFPPTVMYAAADRTEGLPILITLLGGLCLVVVFAWLPFLQARFAAENRLRAMFELRAVRELFCRAPLAWLLSIVVVYVLALPMYLGKVKLPPQDAMWMVTILFIVTIYPARVMTGWAYARAVRRERPAWYGFRWLARTTMLPLLVVYTFLVFFSQAIGDLGKLALFAHHAFLVPAPF